MNERTDESRRSLVEPGALPGHARVWCFGASSRPSDDALARMRESMSSFLAEWTAHRAQLRAAFDWLHDRFLVVAVDESDVEASGCSIDALTNQIRRLEELTGVTLLDSAPVWYRDSGGEIRRVDRREFRQRADRGEIGPETRVFDLTVETLEDVRTGAWEVEAGRSWHAALL